MKRLRALSSMSCLVVGAGLAVALQSCAANQPMKQEKVASSQVAAPAEPGGPAPIRSVEEARQLLRDYQGKAADFVLPVPSEGSMTMSGKPVSLDVALAIITDIVLEKGWLTAGYDEKGGVRYYKYSQ